MPTGEGVKGVGEESYYTTAWSSINHTIPAGTGEQYNRASRGRRFKDFGLRFGSFPPHPPPPLPSVSSTGDKQED
jgi:hypothetical protein